MDMSQKKDIDKNRPNIAKNPVGTELFVKHFNSDPSQVPEKFKRVQKNMKI